MRILPKNYSYAPSVLRNFFTNVNLLKELFSGLRKQKHFIQCRSFISRNQQQPFQLTPLLALLLPHVLASIVNVLLKANTMPKKIKCG
jgi:hypothetical protein